MISDRLYLIIYYICKAGCISGAFAIRFDRQTLTALHCTNHKTKKLVIVTTFLTRSWLIASIFITAKEFRHGGINEFVVKLLFTLCGVIVFIILSIAVQHVDDLMILTNLALGLLQDTQGNFLNLLNDLNF